MLLSGSLGVGLLLVPGPGAAIENNRKPHRLAGTIC